ncbi:MAG: signal peptide peptidase SppA [Bacteroidales bacterium]
MKSFFKYLLASVLGVLLAGIIMMLIFFGTIGAMISAQDKPVEIEEHTVLHLDFANPIADRSNKNPMQNFDFASLEMQNQLGLNDILKNLEKAKEDPKVDGIYLDLTFIPAGFATVEEIRNGLIDFKSSGKFILAFADTYTQPTYYLASVADELYLNPEGMVTWVGLRSEVLFFREAFDKIGVEPQIIRHGKFKSAVEPFMQNYMSEANREQVSAYMGSIWDHMVKGISEQRGVSIEKLNELADNMALISAQDVVDNKLVDGLKYKDEILAMLREKTGKEADEDITSVMLAKYDKTPRKREGKGLAKDKIAVVYAMGNVIMGEGAEGTIGSDRISRAIRKARKDSSVKAIVFRVNSGGGSALSSEIIWREVALAADEKPVIASLGDVAASGGYYIVSPAHKIVASPNTITGSIGVFGLMFNASELMEDKVGVHVEVVKTNDHADLGSTFRALTAQEREVIQQGVEDVYETFVKRVADGRGMTQEAVDAIGQGRVWSGANAMEIGLVDEFGGLEEAIAIAAEEADLERYRVMDLPKLKDPFEQFIKELGGNVEARIMQRRLGEHYRFYQELDELLNMEGVQARIPYRIEMY